MSDGVCMRNKSGRVSSQDRHENYNPITCSTHEKDFNFILFFCEVMFGGLFLGWKQKKTKRNIKSLSDKCLWAMMMICNSLTTQNYNMFIIYSPISLYTSLRCKTKVGKNVRVASCFENMKQICV